MSMYVQAMYPIPKDLNDLLTFLSFMSLLCVKATFISFSLRLSLSPLLTVQNVFQSKIMASKFLIFWR